LFFLSNLSGHISLYAMRFGGSVPQPLLPPHIAMVNPTLLEGSSLFHVFPKLGKIIVMLDHDGDEQYQPMVIPMQGGYPQPAFPGLFDNMRCTMGLADDDANLAYFAAELNDRPVNRAYRCNLATGEATLLGEGMYGPYPAAHAPDHQRLLLQDGYTAGDSVLYYWQAGQTRLLYGTPLEQRAEGQAVPPNALANTHFAPSGQAVLLTSALFDDRYSPGLLPLSGGEIQPV
jgi:hypothetical protein